MCDNNNDYNKIFNRELEINKILFNKNTLPTSFNNDSININHENNLINDNNLKNLDKNIPNIKNGKLRENIIVSYLNNPNKSIGAGFGDFEISKKLRYGKNSRANDYKNPSEIDLNDNHKFHYTFIDYSLIEEFPFERGGTDTRNIEKNSKKN